MTKQVILEKSLRQALCRYPELIEDSLFGIRPGMGVLGGDWPSLEEHDELPNGRQADIVLVQPARITVVETKKGTLTVSQDPAKEDVIDQIVDYIGQCKIKYPGKMEYRGFIVGTRIANKEQLQAKLSIVRENVMPLIFGRDIPSAIRICDRCHRAIPYEARGCICTLSKR
jgi:hypothetical protein